VGMGLPPDMWAHGTSGNHDGALVH